jgi:hypothetical protein
MKLIIKRLYIYNNFILIILNIINYNNYKNFLFIAIHKY